MTQTTWLHKLFVMDCYIVVHNFQTFAIRVNGFKLCTYLLIKWPIMRHKIGLRKSLKTRADFLWSHQWLFSNLQIVYMHFYLEFFINPKNIFIAYERNWIFLFICTCWAKIWPKQGPLRFQSVTAMLSRFSNMTGACFYYSSNRYWIPK